MTRLRAFGTPRPASRSADVAGESGPRARRSAPTASASSPRLSTRPRGCGTPRPASRSASRSRDISLRYGARRSAPTASASSPRLGTKQRASGTRRAASRSANRSEAYMELARFLRSAAFSPDGQRIVTASADGTARIWDVAKTGYSRSASRLHRAMRMVYDSAPRSAPTASASSPRHRTRRVRALWDAASRPGDRPSRLRP